MYIITILSNIKLSNIRNIKTKLVDYKLWVLQIKINVYYTM